MTLQALIPNDIVESICFLISILVKPHPFISYLIKLLNYDVHRYLHHNTLFRGLFIGRFQPFHLGHLATIKFALRNVEKLMIIIGSAQKSHEIRNPFTAGERIQMINDSLNAQNDIDPKRVLIIPVPDVDVHSLWTHFVDILIPKYEVVFTNDSFTRLLFQERGMQVVEPLLYKRKELSATKIRSSMAKDRDWQKLVTRQTAKVVEDIHGIERIKAIFAKHVEKTNH